MKNNALIASAGLLAVAAWLLVRGQQAEADQAAQDAQQDEGAGQGGGLLADAGQVLKDTITTITTMGTLRLSDMRTVTAADVAHPNVRALLAVIRRGEGTSGPNGYRTLFGGGLFEGYADHPRQRITRTLKNGKRITSTAAGAYQFLATTWDETARIMGLKDFAPASQERAAVGRIAARGALEDAKAGRLSLALSKVAHEWASMPGSPYGQPVITEQTARTVYASAGGTINA